MLYVYVQILVGIVIVHVLLNVHVNSADGVYYIDKAVEVYLCVEVDRRSERARYKSSQILHRKIESDIVCYIVFFTAALCVHIALQRGCVDIEYGL